MTMAAFLDSHYPDRTAILADLDGTLIAGTQVLPDVENLVARCGERLWVVSNNSTETARSMSFRLEALGLDIVPQRILLAGEVAIEALAQRYPGGSIVLFAEEPLRELANELGLRTHRGTEPAACAFLAREEVFNFQDLRRLIGLLHRGLELHLSNPDPIYPGADGTPGPETGALYAALKAALPDLTAQSLAKPSAHLLQLALQRAGVAAKDAVFVGDTDATDGAAARAAGMSFALLHRPQLEPRPAGSDSSVTKVAP